MNNNSADSIDSFRVSPSVHHRPSALMYAQPTENGYMFAFKAMVRKSVLSYTHETALNLYKPADPVIDGLYLHICIVLIP